MLWAGMLSAATGGCAAGGGTLRLWAASDMTALTDRTPPSEANGVWDGQVRTVSLAAAANETVSFQLVIDAGEDGARGVRVSVGPFGKGGAKAGAPAVRLYRMAPVEVRNFPSWYLRLTDQPVEPARFYDALIPIDPARRELPDLAAGERLAVWVDVAVPRDALAGEYQADIAVRSGGATRRATLKLKVYDLVLPDYRAVPCIGGFTNETIFRLFIRRRDAASGRERTFVPDRLDTDGEEVRAALVIIRELMRMAHDHRLDLFDKSIRPAIKRDRDAKVELRWEDYDSIVKPYLDGTAFDDRIGVAAWPAPLRADWPRGDHYGGTATKRYRQTVSDVRDQTVAHFKELGAERKLFFWPRTGGGGAEGYRSYVALARLIRQGGAGTPMLTTLSPSPPAARPQPPKGFASLAEMFAPAGDRYDFSAATKTAAGDLAGVYLRPGPPPYLPGGGVGASPADVRALAWLAMKYRCRGIFMPEVLDPAGDPRSHPAAERLFYPHDGRFVASVRLKWLRRGLQDAAYLWLLVQRRRPSLAKAATDTMVRYGSLAAAGEHYLDPRLNGWVRDGQLWLAARKVLLEEAHAAVHPEAVSKQQLRAQQLAWRALRSRACRMRVERARARILPRAGGGFRASVTVELHNELATALDAELRLDRLPEGWRASEPSRKVRLGAGERAAVTLSAEGQAVATGPDGKLEFGATLTPSVGGAVAVKAAAPFIRAGAVTGKINIDGRLDDWPMRPGNTAGGFVLLGRRGAVGDGLARRQTAVFALRDERNLYLAFRCEEPQPGTVRALPSNLLDYDQLLALGEDLVEVILDPGNQAAAAEDLYHLAAKCNGAVLAERGIRVDPPLGKAGPWAAAAAVAVGKQPKAWAVEMRIPLASFGQAGDADVWGMNFARFATAGCEASSWTGAARHFYDPKDMGTVYLVPAPGGGRTPASAPARK